ncbi:hypothetical protein [Streptomyces sp. R41]|uniref:Uncharacterized protein n=1 Tax=Streptomyces sp. R41 TaxID=3238632 RepID=A0AB39RTL0_9ACTN
MRRRSPAGQDLAYQGFMGQPVELQFKKAGAAHYSTVKTVKTDQRLALPDHSP